MPSTVIFPPPRRGFQKAKAGNGKNPAPVARHRRLCCKGFRRGVFAPDFEELPRVPPDCPRDLSPNRHVTPYPSRVDQAPIAVRQFMETRHDG